ncbi:MAG TPA: ergothioneine biosynthesis protein EgtB [Steroidobacteraceae bacterium]|nr:ergothioneine biosynthesis protein EgtB [Steroidobacteraceae bacterium]
MATHPRAHFPAARSGATAPRESPSLRYRTVRQTSLEIAAALEIEDQVVQSMPDVSPTKWHLGHTSWFFEEFLLGPRVPGYRPFDERFGYLFNSYYESVGPRHARPCRGLLTRPTLREVLRYRAHVDEHMTRLVENIETDSEVWPLVELGLNHEQQHQELMLTDLKHVLSCNPLEPAYRSDLEPSATAGAATPMGWIAFGEGLREIGTDGEAAFCFDNETPRHREWLEAFELADRLVTNAEYLEFIRAGGYRQPTLWLSDGWSVVQQQHWSHPLYWSDDLATEFTLAGRRSLDPAAPVCHLSYFEADAFARWAAARLPTEAEWETAAAGLPVEGNLMDRDALRPLPAAAGTGLRQMFGDVWEWTRSPYGPYPGFRPAAGAIGEYNGKFMCSQFVLRGGSCATPADHIRPGYRNFFYPHSRWQFTGLRLARDLGS